MDEVQLEPGEDVIKIHLQYKEHVTKLGTSLGKEDVDMIPQVLI